MFGLELCARLQLKSLHVLYPLLFSLSERFFHSVHPTLPKSSSSIGEGGKCPFRAMLQGQEVHNSAPLTGAPQTMSAPSSGEGVEGGSEGSNCKCVTSGRKPKGQF